MRLLSSMNNTVLDLCSLSVQVQVWQDAFPGVLRGQLARLAGAEILAINNTDPFAAVDVNAAIAGSYQAGCRQELL
jgi:hypothetical protein